MPRKKIKLVKTRQLSGADNEELGQFAPRSEPPRGVLRAIAGRGSGFSHQRFAPPPELQAWVQHFWTVTWDLRGRDSSVAETLPHPSCYLVFEHDLAPPTNGSRELQCEISGVTTGKFTRILEGHRRVLGVKFKPGALRPFLGQKVSLLTDKVVPAAAVFGASIVDLASDIYHLRDAEAFVRVISRYLIKRCEERADPKILLSSQLVDLILKNPSILTVEHLAQQSGYGLRTLQRLFQEYVGVSPKWVIRRYRLHEVLERLHQGGRVDVAQLAPELGYVDQAHLINDFRNLAGYTPEAYRRRTAVNR
jgi:AraC-like DNA-binding protein